MFKEECIKIFESLCPETLPQKKVEEGENILFPSYDASNNNIPTNALCISYEDLMYNSDKSKERRYLWVIKTDGIFIALESTPNEKAKRKMLCHSNITGNKKAAKGGELWFSVDNKVYINFKSGRYPTKDDSLKLLIVNLFLCVGYKEVVIVEKNSVS